MTVIIIRNSNTSGSVPPSGSLVLGELAVNTADGGLYYHNSSSDAVQLIRASGTGGSGPASSGTGSFTGSFTGAFQGIGEGITGVISSSYATTSSFALRASEVDTLLTAEIQPPVATYTGSYVTESLRFWYKSDVGVTTGSGDAVTTWQNLAESGNDLTQSIGASQPILYPAASGAFGIPFVGFDGVDDYLIVSLSAAYTGSGLPARGTITIGMLLQPGTDTGVPTDYDGILSMPTASATEHDNQQSVGFTFNNAENYYEWEVDRNSTTHRTNKYFENVIPLVIRIDGEYVHIWQGLEVDTFVDSEATFDITHVVLGARYSASGIINNFGSPRIAELLVYDLPLGPGEVQQLLNYLSQRAGIQIAIPAATGSAATASYVLGSNVDGAVESSSYSVTSSYASVAQTALVGNETASYALKAEELKDFFYSSSTEGFTVSGGVTGSTLTISTGSITFEGGSPNTYDMPPSSDTLVGEDSIQTLINKIITGSFTGTFAGDGTNVINVVTASYADSAGATGGGLTGDGVANRIAAYSGPTTLKTSSITDNGTLVQFEVPISGSSFTASLGFLGDGSQITGVVSSSFADNALNADSASDAAWDDVRDKPVGIVSSSTQFTAADDFIVGQIDAVGVSGSFTGSFIGDASQLTGVTASGGTADTASYVEIAQTASYVETAQTASYVAAANIDGIVESASFANSALSANTAASASDVAWDDVRDKVDGLISSSVQLEGTFLEIEGDGVISSSVQFTSADDFTVGQINTIGASGSFTGTLAGTSSFADYASTVLGGTANADTASYVLGSNVDGTVESASYAITASYAANGGSPGSSFTWSEVTADLTGSTDNGYFASGSSQIKVYLPATSALGDSIKILGVTTAGWRIAQGPSQTIHFGLYSSTAGEAGYVESNNQRDSIEIVCVATDEEWQVAHSIGNMTIN